MSNQYFTFEDWFKSLTLSKDVHDNYEGTILDLVANSNDVSSYTTSHNLIVNNIGFIEKDECEKYFIELQIPRIADITSGFIAYPYYGSENASTDIKINVILNGQILPIIAATKLVNACAMYTEIKIRLTFSDQPFDVRFKYVNYVLQSQLRQNIIQKRFIQDGIKYSDGVAMKQ